MTFGMLDDPSEMEGYASAVARVAGIPQQHVEKDFWITEALRGVANASRDTARHYYDVDVLLRSRAVLNQLKLQGADILAREVARHSTAAGLPSAERPAVGFAQSPAWASGQDEVEQSYNDALRLLVWPNAETSTFEECCKRVHALANLL